MSRTLATYPKYDSYKPSGVDWLNQIPGHWRTKKLRTLLSAFSEKNRANLPLLSITRNLGVIVRDVEDMDDNHNYIPEDLSGYKVIKTGQFGMNKMKAWQGSYGVSDHTGIVSPAYYVFDLSPDVFAEFFHWAIRSKLYVSSFAQASDGVRVGQWDLSKPRMREISFIVPDIDEQKAITAFLDQKTAKIDQAIEIKEEQIALLLERKKIEIQTAVTRGLDPNAPMKDSGIDWIGQIPAHWESKRLKYLFQETDQRTSTGEETLFSLRMNIGLVAHNQVSDKEILPDALIGYRIILPGQMVMNRMRAAIGIFGVADAEGLVSPDYAIFNLSPKADKSFFLRLFKTAKICREFFVKSKGLGTGSSGFMRLYTENFGDIKVALPPLDEQEKIAAYLRTRTDEIDQAIEWQHQQIDALKEYKASLIDSAVTGKIKVTPDMVAA